MTELPSYSNSTASFNQPDTETIENSNHDAVLSFNPELTLGASAAHGVLTGVVNGLIQYLANKYSRHGEQGSTTKAVLIYSSMFLNAAIAATFPLMLLKIQEYINQGDEDEAQKLWDTMLSQALPTFIANVSSTLGLQIVNECTRLLSDQSKIRAIAQNTLPILGTAISAIKNPLATATQMVTSIAASSRTYCSLIYFFPVKKPQFDVENANANNCTEMQSLNNEEEQTETQLTDSEIKNQENLLYFIKQANLEGMRKSLNLISIHMAGICSIYEKNISALETAKENIPDNKRALLDNSYPDHLILLKQDLKNIQDYQVMLGMKKIQNFKNVSYIEALKTASKANLILEENPEKYANEYVRYLTKNEKNIDTTIQFAKFIEMSINDETYTIEKAYPQHNKACKGFTIESILVNDKSVMELLMLTKKISEILRKFKENLLKIEGTDVTYLPKGAFDEIKHIKDFIDFILIEINQNIIKKYDNYAQAVRVMKNKPLNEKNEGSKHLRNKSSVSYAANRPMTFHGGDSDRSCRTSSGEESTSSGISTANSIHDNEEQQIRRQLVP